MYLEGRKVCQNTGFKNFEIVLKLKNRKIVDRKTELCLDPLLHYVFTHCMLTLRSALIG